MGSIKRIFVEKKESFAVEAKGLCNDLRNNLGMQGITGIRICNRYDVMGLSEDEFAMAKKLVDQEVKNVLVFPYNAEVIFDDFGLNGIMLCGKEKGVPMENLEIRNNEALISIKDFNPKSTPLDSRYQTVEQHGGIKIDYMA